MRFSRLFLIATLAAPSLWAQVPSAAPAPPSPLTLSEVVQMAKANSAQFRSALADAAIAREDKIQARAALLPGVNYNNQFLYTEGNGTASGRYVANNAVHEYLSQGNAHEVISVQQFADYRKASAAAAVAHARSEANHFLDLSQKLEHGGEVAHSDVLKAQLQANDRKRDLRESELDLLKARLELAVLIFPTYTTDFTLVDDLDTDPPLPELARVQQGAAQKNPELKAAMAAVNVSHSEVLSSLSAHLPALSLDYFYGIDATHFATRTGDVRNLGYAATATLNIPIFNWGAAQSKVRQSQAREDVAKIELSTTQRQLLANVQTMYSEAEAAASELTTLRQSAEIAAESLRLVTLRYQAGESTVLEVVDAQNTLSTARNAYADGSQRYRVALANLQTLTGSL
jgi:outer membrane protein TolC